ncbi:MAG: hypothetical protein AAGJ46_14085 [Planctomycetota bacterium]
MPTRAGCPYYPAAISFGCPSPAHGAGSVDGTLGEEMTMRKRIAPVRQPYFLPLAGVVATLFATAPADAQPGWTGASSDSRFGTAAAPAADPSALGPAPSAPPIGSGAQPRASQPGPFAPAAAPITPIQPSSPAAGLQPAGSGPAASPGLTQAASSAPSRVNVSRGNLTQLPTDHGQVYREYDLRPYTLRVTNQPQPEQTVVDWVLRETGYEAWHSDVFSFLVASRETLRVYHTEQMHGLVRGILDRFVNSQASTQAFSLRIATVRNPNWRAEALTLMSPIPVQSPGMQGWIMPKENAAILLSQLTRRSDWREHSASNQMVLNGHKVVLSTMRPRSYIKGVIRTQNTWPGFQPETGQLEEGATMEFSPLLSHDMKSAEAVIKIRINQVEKMAKVRLDIPTQATGTQRMQIEVPQMTMANVHERFRWPADHVLVLSLGVVPPPTQTGGGNPLAGVIPGISNAARADGLLLVEARGTAMPSATPGAPGARTALQPGTFSGRY